MKYDKDKIKDLITNQDIYNLLDYLNADPRFIGEDIVCRTICHGGDKEALYYYANSKLFHCYSDNCGSFDVYELITKVNNMNFTDAIAWVAEYFHLYAFTNEDNTDKEDWKILQRYMDNFDIHATDEFVSLPEYSISLLKYYPQPEILPWTREGITKEICDFAQIHYNPIDGSILIPHFDASNRMIGIRKRTLIRDQERFGKYIPWQHNDIIYKHPLAFNLYGLNWAKNPISEHKVAIVVEGEKSVLQYMSMFGYDNNLCVSVCGQNISLFQFKLLYGLGIRELCIGFDKDFEELGDHNWQTVIERLQKLNEKFTQYVNVSFLFDKEDLLPYKGSPTDAGQEVFLYLWKNRIMI